MSNTNPNYTSYLNMQNINTSYTNPNISALSNQNLITNNSSSNSTWNSYFSSYSNNTQVQARSLWIGDIDPWMDEGFMIKIFQEVATVKNLKIIRDKAKGTSLGYGFVEFDNPEIAKDVLNTLNGKFIQETNKTLKLNWASYSAGKQALMNSNQGIVDYSIYVGDLDLSITEDSLKEFFCKFYYSVIGVKVIIDPINRNSKGYGFVKFSEQSEANRALTEMNGRMLNGKAIKTNQASFKKITSEFNSGGSQPNYSPNICNTQSPYPTFINFPNNFNSSDSYSYNNNTNNISYSDFLPNISQSIASKPKALFHSSNAVTSLRNNPGSKLNTNINSNDSGNKTNMNLLNLNNFYIHNPNLDYTSDIYSAGSNYNLNHFYYNNYNQNKSKLHIFGNKSGTNNINNNHIHNYNINYFNYMNNLHGQHQYQQQSCQNNNIYGYLYNHGNISNTNFNNKILNNPDNFNDATQVDNISTNDEKGNNLS